MENCNSVWWNNLSCHLSRRTVNLSPSCVSLLPMEGGENQAWQMVPMLKCLQMCRDANMDQPAKIVPKGICPASHGGYSSLWFPPCGPPWVTLLERNQGAQRAEKTKYNTSWINSEGRGWLRLLKINGGEVFLCKWMCHAKGCFVLTPPASSPVLRWDF